MQANHLFMAFHDARNYPLARRPGENLDSVRNTLVLVNAVFWISVWLQLLGLSYTNAGLGGALTWLIFGSGLILTTCIEISGRIIQHTDTWVSSLMTSGILLALTWLIHGVWGIHF
jgi:hypothetical protein